MDENAMAELMAGGGSESDDAVDVDEEEESKLENQPEVKAAPKKKAPAAAKKDKPPTKAAGKKGDKAAGKEAPGKHAKAAPVKIMMEEAEAKTAVAAYMEAQNRPYSIQNVMDNMHGRIHRKICQQVLDDLSDEKVLVCKEFGKAKIYLANQDKFPETSKEELADLDAQIA